MGPCCKYCYKQYINKDRSIDKEFVKKEFGEDVNINETKYVETIYTEKKFLYFFNRTVKTKEDRIKFELSKDGKKIDLCNCDCHQKGIVVLH